MGACPSQLPRIAKRKRRHPPRIWRCASTSPTRGEVAPPPLRQAVWIRLSNSAGHRDRHCEPLLRTRRNAPRLEAPEVCLKSLAPIRGRGECRMRAAPAVPCAKWVKKTHTSIQVQRRRSGIPCAMVLRFSPRSPRRRIRLVTVVDELTAYPRPVGPTCLRQLDTSNGCQDHTASPYAATSFVCAPFHRSRVWLNPKPALQFTCAPIGITPSETSSINIEDARPGSFRRLAKCVAAFAPIANRLFTKVTSGSLAWQPF